MSPVPGFCNAVDRNDPVNLRNKITKLEKENERLRDRLHDAQYELGHYSSNKPERLARAQAAIESALAK